MRLPFLKFIDGEPVTKEEVAEMYREMAEKQALDEERLKEEALKKAEEEEERKKKEEEEEAERKKIAEE